MYYANPKMAGLERISSRGDGYSINVRWYPAYPTTFTNKIAYHIYYATDQYHVYTEGVKYISIDGSLEANLIDLIPGQSYWASIRPVEYDPTIVTFLPQLPIAHDNVRVYPSSILRQNMSATDLIVPLLDVEGFTSQGFVKIGAELIEYLAVDPVNDNLIVPAPGADIPAYLVLQSNQLYYLPNPTNVGNGSIANLTLVDPNALTETWIIKCVEVPPDGYAPPRFETFGSISGNIVDQYGNYPVWVANGPIVSNGVLSFSIVQTSPTFQPGDFFTIQTAGVVLGAPGGRGFNNTPITMHTVSGFDGYNHWSPIVSEFAFAESSSWDQIYACQSRFEYPHFPYTPLDGFDQVPIDYLSTDYHAADAANVTFPEYDFAGYHRTDLVQLVDGTCVGTYIGGQQGCIDGYGNYNVYRGISMQDQNTQRQDLKLQLDGQPACLIRRRQTGVICNCYLASSEYPDDRCPYCLGGKFVLSYNQYFDPRHSDGRIRVRLSPTDEQLKMYEAGLESEFPLPMWTLTVPTIKMRDVLVLFDQDDNESFRYEVGAVTHNQMFIGLDGGQNLKTFRVRKTDPIYQIRVYRNTADFPQRVNTSLGFAPGLPPHVHEVTRSGHDPSAWSQLTQVSQGHNHAINVIDGVPVIMEALHHTHKFLLG